jgi:RNA polymerase sigma factor (sigma-70 family)
MRPRKDLVETFSSFVQFEADRFCKWGSDPRLKRNMQRCSDRSDRSVSHSSSDGHSSSDSSEGALSLSHFWMLYWYKQWQTEPQSIAKAHLLAYLQEACYWVAYKAGTGFTSTQYGVADCFQLAIAHLDKILKGFNTEQGFDLKNYASAAFSSLIRDQLRQRREVDICTDWSLLRKVSQKRLVTALQVQGLTGEELERYLLAWRAYRLIYTPERASGTRRLSAPNAASWMAIAQQANTERASLTTPNQPVSAQQIETWLATAAKAVRSYLYPGAVSMNATIAGQDAGEYLDSLSDADQTSPLKAAIDREEQTQRREQQTQLNAVLTEAIAQLDPPSQKLLTLYYQEGATQQAIAAQLSMQQYAISRAIARIKKTLMMTLAKWGQETLHITPSPDVLKHTSAALEEWLVTHYRPFAQQS